MSVISVDPVFQSFLDDAFAEWMPNSSYSLLKQFGGGKSGAFVYLIDIYPASMSTREMGDLSGTFILKLEKKRPWSTSEPTEFNRHKAAETQDAEFTSKHLPQLLKFKESSSETATLYSIAGFSLKNIISASNVDANVFQSRASDLSYSLLALLNRRYEIQADIPAATSIEDWLGYRLKSAEAPRLHKFVEAETANRKIFALAGRLLVNPLWLATSAELRSTPTQSRFVGIIHGDLHSENVLMNRFHKGGDRNYWLIDWALSRTAPLFFDHAYFELSILVRHLEGTEPERLLNLLDALQEMEESGESFKVPITEVGVVSCLAAIRRSVVTWQSKSEAYRPDAVQAQYLLAMVAASLNWANKPLPEASQRLSLAFGAWFATKYLRVFHEESLTAGWKECESYIARADEIDRAQIDTENPESWDSLWKSMNGFSSSNVKFVLISGLDEVTEDYASLGFVPWSAIIDFDPNSNEAGLHSRIVDVLETHRSVKQFGLQPQPANFSRATSWLMANGWTTRNEDSPTDLKVWRHTYIPSIRRFVESIRVATAPQIIKVLVLPGKKLSGARLERVLETIDVELGEFGHITLLGDVDLEDSSLISTKVSLQPDYLAGQLRRIFGAKGETRTYFVPGATGPVPIPLDRLRNLEEDLDILHSAILNEVSSEIQDETVFLRGAPPTWMDLQLGSDIERTIHPDLVKRLEELLQESSNRTLELHHSPGAGGTTSALRVAWTLRTIHPTVILRRTSKLTLDRLDELFHLTQRPLLLIAEASILPQQHREELVRGLSERNARVVILYVQRTLNQNDNHPFRLITPMLPAEAGLFFEIFSSQTREAHRIEKLREMSFSSDSPIAIHRSPFFYGLTTFESEFTSVNRYVEAFLREATYPIKRVVKFIALVTRFAQNGMDRALFNRVLGLEADSVVSLGDAVGTGPAQLIIEFSQKIKLMHPVIAEEVLRQLLGGPSPSDWIHALKDLSIEFIQEIVRILGADSEETNGLFEQLFIRRGEWFVKRERKNFAEIINLLPSVAGQHQVLEFLTEVCPTNPHYWNHLGRHHIYEMKQDFLRAEEYLQRAVELDPENSVHHHSLGMVRRFWVDDILKKLARSAPIDPDILLDEVEELVDRAADAFQESRRLNPQENYGYITHIQLILSVAERLISALGGSERVGGINRESRASSWLRTNLILAENLLFHVQQLRADKEPSKLELRCVNRLNALYGNFDETIAAWRSMLNKDSGQVDLRRAIAYALHTKSRRRWDLTSKIELQQIVDLMEDNLRVDPTNEGDIRMWFQAYKRLPEFSFLHALDRLETWARRSETVEPYYYLYILHFLLWLEKKERNETQIEEMLDHCRPLAIGKRGHSYEWLGIGPDWCPLVFHRELGEFDRQAGFYANTDGLAYCSGSIEVIKGPKAGTIRIGKTTRAFFVPGNKFRASHDINAIVHFFVGFSYDGLRAWEVDFGSIPWDKATNVRSELAEPISIETIGATSRGEDTAKNILVARKDNALSEADVRMFIVEELSRSSPMLLSQLGGRLKSRFGKKSVHQYLGYDTLEAFLAAFGEFKLVGEHTKRSVEFQQDSES